MLLKKFLDPILPFVFTTTLRLESASFANLSECLGYRLGLTTAAALNEKHSSFNSLSNVAGDCLTS